MFSHDIVFCRESSEQVKGHLKRWRFAIKEQERRSGTVIQWMCVNERESSGTVKLQKVEVKKVEDVKYQVSTDESNREGGRMRRSMCKQLGMSGGRFQKLYLTKEGEQK